MQFNERQALMRLQENPRRVLENARKGMTQDLMELANSWPNNGSELLNLGIVEVFLTHLDGTLIPGADSPSTTSRAARRSPAQPNFANTPAMERAWMSIVGLSKVGPFIGRPDPKIPIAQIEKTLVEGWGGTFKWCNLIYGARIAPISVSGANSRPSPPRAFEIRRTAMDSISALFYAFSRSENIRSAMVKVPGTVEMATRLWILEDEGPVPSTQPIPVGSAGLDGLLTVPDHSIKDDETIPGESKEEREDRLDKKYESNIASLEALLDRVVTAAGGSVNSVIHLVLTRLKGVTSSPAISTPHSAIYLDLLGHLSRGPTHPLRMGFLSEGAISMCTKLAVKFCGLLDRSLGESPATHAHIGFGGPDDSLHSQSSLTPKDNLLGGLVASLGYLTNYIESSDGFSWVSNALSAGLLNAWVGAVKYMKYVDPEDADMVLSLLRDRLPRYLVYRSVVLNVKSAVGRLREAKPGAKNSTKAYSGKADWDIGRRKGEGDDLGMVQWSLEARKVWRTFEKLAMERYLISVQMKAMKGMAVTCDNVKCQKVDVKNNFMKCSGCYNTLYCSRECQVAAWKEGEHKKVCKLKQQELAEGKYHSIGKADSDYFHHLSTRDARYNLPQLQKLAKASYPDLPPTALVVCIDYMKYPTRFSVHPLSEHDKYAPRISLDASANAEARNDELITRAMEHPGKYGIIQSKIANGQGTQLVLSVVTGSFWDEAGWPVEEAKYKYRAEEDNDDDEEESLLSNLMQRKGTLDDLDGIGNDRQRPRQDMDESMLARGRQMLNAFLVSRGEPPTF